MPDEFRFSGLPVTPPMGRRISREQEEQLIAKTKLRSDNKDNKGKRKSNGN